MDTRGRFVDTVRTALGVDQQKYCSHSFHIGVATTAAARGIEDSMIKTMGRWDSVVYLQYVYSEGPPWASVESSSPQLPPWQPIFPGLSG